MGDNGMPLYDYSCIDCGKLYEISVKLELINKEIKCPKCGKTLKKLVSAPRRITIH